MRRPSQSAPTGTASRGAVPLVPALLTPESCLEASSTGEACGAGPRIMAKDSLSGAQAVRLHRFDEGAGAWEVSAGGGTNLSFVPKTSLFLNLGRDILSTLPRGNRREIKGLVAGAQHNGKLCTLTKFNETSERWQAELDGGATLRVKPANLIEICVPIEGFFPSARLSRPPNPPSFRSGVCSSFG